MKKLVYIPCGFERFEGPFLFETADGWFGSVDRARIELVETQLCLVAELLGRDADGRFQVRLPDGETALVRPSREWRYIPDGSEPWSLADFECIPSTTA